MYCNEVADLQYNERGTIIYSTVVDKALIQCQSSG